MPGDPVQNMLSRASLRAEAAEVMYGYYTQAFGLDVPIGQQYLNFWTALFHGDLGTSVYMFPTPVTKVLLRAVPYDIFLLIPSILLSWYAGNKFGAYAARSKWLDNTVSPLGYVQSTGHRKDSSGTCSLAPRNESASQRSGVAPSWFCSSVRSLGTG